jgi:hypothetical protein
VAARADVALVDLEEVRDPPVGESHALERTQVVAAKLGERALLEQELDVDDLLDLRQEPGIDLRVAVDFFHRHADAERIGDVPEPLGARIRELVADLVGIDGLEVEAVDAGLEAAQRLSAATPGTCGRSPSLRRPTSSAS